jgi:hypothetical protein
MIAAPPATKAADIFRLGELPFTDNDFSTKTIARHKRAGYLMTKRAIEAG